MPQKAKDAESWMSEAAVLMVRENRTFKEAISFLGVPLTSADADLFSRRAAFKRLVAKERDRYYQEIGSNPGLTKEKVVGQLQALADKLEAESLHDKAANVLFQLAKIKNWVGETGNINVFGNLSQKDIDEMREKLKQEDACQPTQIFPAN
jgi:hypothetical protein